MAGLASGDSNLAARIAPWLSEPDGDSAVEFYTASFGAVDDLDEALKGREILIAPTSHRLAFVSRSSLTMEHRLSATRLSTRMLFGSGVLLTISGVALFFAPESKAGRAPAPPNER